MAIITGGPGTGKTTLIRSITTIFESLNRGVLLCAPTGRAAKRLSEVTGRDAFTIHRMLQYSPSEDGFAHNRDNPLDAQVVIVDEASMVDTYLMRHLLEALKLTSRLILVGDVNQLPSVGPGNVLSDLIESGAIATFKLREIHRQAKASPIISAWVCSMRLQRNPTNPYTALVGLPSRSLNSSGTEYHARNT